MYYDITHVAKLNFQEEIRLTIQEQKSRSWPSQNIKYSIKKLLLKGLCVVCISCNFWSFSKECAHFCINTTLAIFRNKLCPPVFPCVVHQCVLTQHLRCPEYKCTCQCDILCHCANVAHFIQEKNLHWLQWHVHWIILQTFGTTRQNPADKPALPSDGYTMPEAPSTVI